MHQDFKFGLSSKFPENHEINEGQEKRIKRLLDHRNSDDVLNVCRHYIQHFIPLPVENENKYWMISVYPDKGTMVRVNIYWHEVLHIAPQQGNSSEQDNLNVMIFMDDQYLTSEVKKALQTQLPGTSFDPEFWYEKGLDSQIAAFVPIAAYDEFVADLHVSEAIKQYNHQLSSRGKIVHKPHNHAFVLRIFE